jgi:hypothetical protein
MNYQRAYDRIIERAKRRSLDCYFETHHIVPRSLGGSDDPRNLVDLTYREHFLVHWLLTKIYTKRGRRAMFYALMCMGTMNPGGQRIIMSWQYEVARRAWRDRIDDASDKIRAKRLDHRSAVVQDSDKRLRQVKDSSDKIKQHLFEECTRIASTVEYVRSQRHDPLQPGVIRFKKLVRGRKVRIIVDRSSSVKELADCLKYLQAWQAGMPYPWRIDQYVSNIEGAALH